MAKLSNDYIRWTLTLNTSQTKKEIHNLTESSKELEKSNKDLLKTTIIYRHIFFISTGS